MFPSAMNFVEALWVNWYQLWRNEYLGMFMAILCSQELLNFTLGHFSLLHSKGNASKRTWQAFFLALDFAFEYPIVFASFPSVPQTPARVISNSVPGPVGLLFQISVLLLVENVCLIVLPAFEPAQGGEKEDAAATALSKEFLAPKITLLFGIPLLESILWGRVMVGQVHFGAVVGWLACRHFFVKSRV